MYMYKKRQVTKVAVPNSKAVLFFSDAIGVRFYGIDILYLGEMYLIRIVNSEITIN